MALCFGSRKLFRAQFALARNVFGNHHEWLDAWRTARSSQFYLVGSRDEAGGNQSCTATLAENGTFTLRLRLPGALIELGETVATGTRTGSGKARSKYDLGLFLPASEGRGLIPWRSDTKSSFWRASCSLSSS